MINLKIYEENNNLSFKENYSPIVCGNSNYEITFEFSSDWQSINNKTAIIIVGGKKTAKDFSGSTLTLPVIPNCNSFMLMIFSSEGETTRLVSSPIEIEATPTSYAENLPEFEPLTTYVSELLTKINKMLDGTTKVKNAEKADVATSTQNVSNPNLLINGDFRINQRGKTSYVCTKNEYTVDRWLGASGLTVTKNANSISLTNTNSSESVIFQQKLEEPFLNFAGKTLCLSATIDGSLHYASAQLPTAAPTSATTLISKQLADGVTIQLAYLSTNMLSAQISLSAGKTITLTNTKLELGTIATAFSPRTIAEELALCQRYFQKTRPFFVGFAQNTTVIFGELFLPCKLRTLPTINDYKSNIFVHGNTGYLGTPNGFGVSQLDDNGLFMYANFENLQQDATYILESGVNLMELDAEIY